LILDFLKRQTRSPKVTQPATRYLFVYGTLKRSQRNHTLLARARFVQEAITQPKYRLYDTGRYPCLVPCQEGGAGIHGEVYEVDDETLQLLDRHEGVPRHYRREPVSLQGFSAPVETYLYNRDTTQLAECGTTWPGPG
jgi:gamma-glutamylcyclotransferase (GGCT)/AIG2-like uncharacterized protein YtfP